MVCVHPKATPAVFIYIRHTMMAISFVLTVIVVCVVKLSSSVTRVYANLLVFLVTGSFSIDLFLQWIFDPAFLSPLICVYRRDPLLKIIPIPAGVCVSLLHSVIALGGLLYFALFIYRHQAILPPLSRYKFSSTKQISFLAALSVPYGSLGASYYMSRVDTRANPYYNASFGADWDSAVIARIDCFIMTTNVLYALLCTTILLFTLAFITTIARHTFLILAEIKHISLKTQALHRILTRSLIAQSLVPVVLVVLPFGFLLTANVIFLTFAPEVMNDFAIDLTDFVILTISFHATSHSFTLLFTTPAFRDTLRKLVARKKKTTAPAVVSVQAAFTSGNE